MTDSVALPEPAEMDRDDALRAFVEVINVAEPDHPYLDDPWPIEESDVEYGVTRNRYGKCGPRRGPRHVVAYKTRMTWINKQTIETYLAHLAHEVTHVPIHAGTTDSKSGHPPEFWREMAFHALLVRDSLQDGRLAEVFPTCDVDQFLEECVLNPNDFTVDRRFWGVRECHAKMADLLGVERGF